MLRTLAMVTGLSAGLLMAGVAPAQAADKASLKVSVIHAKKAKGPVDPALRRIQGTLKKSFGGYHSFKQLAKHKVELPLKKTRQIRLPNGHTAGFTYLGANKEKERVQISIPKSRVDVALSAPKRKMFYQAGLPYQGGILILALYLR